MHRSPRGAGPLRAQLGAAVFWTLMGVAAAALGVHALVEVAFFLAAIGHAGAAVWELRRRRRGPAPSHP